MNAVKAVFGVGLLALAIWMLERILSGTVIMLLWGMLAIACGVYLGALERIPRRRVGWARLWKALGVSLLLFGAIQWSARPPAATTGCGRWATWLKGRWLGCSREPAVAFQQNRVAG